MRNPPPLRERLRELRELADSFVAAAQLLLEETAAEGRPAELLGDMAGARTLAAEVRETERRRIVEALARFGGHQGKAAESLGVSRRTLTNKLTELGLPRPRKGKARE